MPDAFSFTEARIRKLEPPAAGRKYYRDADCRGLQLCITSAGSATYYLVKRIDGRPTRLLIGGTSKFSVKDARDAARALIGQIAVGRDPQAERRHRREAPTIGDAWNHREQYAAGHCSPKTLRENAWRYKKFLKPWATRRLATITRADVQRLHDKIGTENGVYQANQVFALLRWMFNHAEDIGFHGENPTRRIKMFREQSRDRFLQAGELQRFFQAVNAELPEVRDFLLLCLMTGARKNNVLAMRWVDVDLARGLWRIPHTKSGLPVVVPLVGPAVAILEARHAFANGAEWIFPGRRGKPMANPRNAWDRIRTAAGLPDLRQHDLRRSLGSWMAGANVALPIVGRMLGHATPQATAVYARLAVDPIREAAQTAVDAMLAAGGQGDTADE